MPANELNFDTTIPATRVGKLYNYIQIPEFSYAGVMWKGVSEIVVQFNYSLTNNFILRRYPVKPVGVNFNICIKYRVGMTVFRYKLWDSLNEVMPNIPKYTGQLIKKNCVVEIWTVGGLETVSLGDVINLETSILTLPASLTDLSEVENATSGLVLATEFQTAAPALPTTGLYAWYKYGSTVNVSGGKVDSWADSSGNSHTLIGVNPDKPDAILESGAYHPQVSGVKYLTVGGTFSPRAVYLVTKTPKATLAGELLLFGAAGDYMNIRMVGGDVSVIDQASTQIDISGKVPVNTKCVIHERFDFADELLKVDVDSFYAASGATFSGLGEESAGKISIGDDNTLSSETQDVYELIIYNDEVSDTQHIQILQYLANKFNPGGFVLANTFVDGNAWLDNN